MREMGEEGGFHLEPPHTQRYGAPKVSTPALHTQVESHTHTQHRGFGSSTLWRWEPEPSQKKENEEEMRGKVGK